MRAIRGVLVVWVLATGLGLGQEPPKVNMKAFTVLHLAGWGVGMADTSLTAATGLRESNPLAARDSRWRALETTAGWGGLTWMDYRLARRGKKWWWVGPAITIAGHGYGMFTGIRALRIEGKAGGK